MPEIRNHRKNELPLSFPTMPPAKAKPRAMNTYATARAASSESSDGPDDPDDREDHEDRDGERGDDPDDELQQDVRGDDQDADRDGPPGDGRRARPGAFDFLRHTPKGTDAVGSARAGSVVRALQVTVAALRSG